jgi:hypothetical protein
MVATALFLIAFVVVGVLLAGMIGSARSRVRTNSADSGSDGNAGWVPAVFSGDGGSDCSPGDAGCDGGGGGGE